MVKYCLPSVGSDVKLDRRCPHCASPNGNIHSGIHYRRVSDPNVQAIPQHRMKCPACGTTWTLRADGIGKGRQRTDHLRALGVILYMLGLSCRAVEVFLACLKCKGGKSTIERDVDATGANAERYHKAAIKTMRVRILGADGTGAAMAGQNKGLLFFVDVEKTKLIRVEAVHEKDARKVRRHVAEVMAAVGAEELRSDEHSSYKGSVDEPAHRLCLTHWLKSKCKRAADLHRRAVAEDRPLEAQNMKQLLELLRLKPRPPTVPAQLTALVQRYINAHRGMPGQPAGL